MPRSTASPTHPHKPLTHRLRRQPQQARGQQRVDAILDGAEAAFAKVGYEAATTNQIATHAGISIGSIYQFFTNKDAILQAVAARYTQGFFEAFQQHATISSTNQPNIETIVNTVIDGLFDFGVRHLGFVKVALHASEGTPLAALTHKFQQALVARIAPVICQFAAQLGVQISEEDSVFHARLAHSAIKGHVAWAITEMQAGRKASAHRILHHAKHMQVAYFERVLADARANAAQKPVSLH